MKSAKELVIKCFNYKKIKKQRKEVREDHYFQEI